MFFYLLACFFSSSYFSLDPDPKIIIPNPDPGKSPRSNPDPGKSFGSKRIQIHNIELRSLTFSRQSSAWSLPRQRGKERDPGPAPPCWSQSSCRASSSRLNNKEKTTFTTASMKHRRHLASKRPTTAISLKHCLKWFYTAKMTVVVFNRSHNQHHLIIL